MIQTKVTSKIVVATISWARDEEELQLLQRSTSVLQQVSIPVFITDGGSDVRLIEHLGTLANFNICVTSGKGLWAQVKSSLIAAAKTDADFILYTEPDKLAFFTQLPSLISALPLSPESGISLFSRSASSFNSFPAFQRMSETAINDCCAELIGKAHDYTYGPFFLNRKLVDHLLGLPADIGWGWRPFAFNIAARLGLTIDAIEGNFYYPPDQIADDKAERIYRMKQLKENVNGLVLSTTAIL